MTIDIPSEADIDNAASRFLQAIGANRVVAFVGAMGAGKTTFISALCRALQVDDSPNSPTFAIVNEYSSPSAGPVYHFDFYRLRSEDEARDIGAEDYFYSGSYCFIEWPDKVAGILPDDTVVADIDVAPDGVRSIHIDL